MAQQWWDSAPVVAPAAPESRPAVEFQKPAAPMSPGEAARLDLATKAAERQAATSTWRTMSPEEVQAAGLSPSQRYQRSDAGEIKPIGGVQVLPTSAERVPQIRSALAALANIRRLAEQPLSVGQMAGRLSDTPVIGALVGQNRADLQGALDLVQGSLIQDQIRELAKVNQGGVSQLANTEREAGRMAASIANLDPNQSLEQFLQGVKRAEDYYNRQLQGLGEQPQAGQAATRPGTAPGQVVGAIQPGELVLTEEDRRAGQAIQEAWNRTGRFEDVAAVAAQFGRSFGREEEAFLRANEGKPVNINANPTGTPTAAEAAVGELVATPGGETAAAATLASANAMTMGLLDELAPVLGLDAERVQMAKRYLQERNPGVSLAGEVVGSVLPTGAVSGGVNAALAGTRAAGMAPLAGDVLAGGLAGAGEANENRMGGALLGGALGGAGGALGRRMFGGGGPDVMPPDGGAPMPGASGGRVSGGAAATPDDVIRVSRSQELPVPVNLANFQKTRSFEQMQRARELAKNNEVGAPIRAKMAEQQKAIADNFDAFIDQTGAEVLGNLEEQGARITAGIRKMADQSKAKYRALYARAEKVGETREPVNYQPLRDYIAGQTATTREKLAPVLRAVEEQLAKNDTAGSGQITLQQAEDIRKLINKSIEPGKPDAVYGGEMKAIIDQITEGAGGDVYKAARAARREHAQLFDEVGIIAQLLGTKRNSVDRVVAAENVVSKLLQRSTPADGLRRMRELLTGEGGDPQAWREVQGAVVERIRQAAYPASATRDEAGNVAVSPAGLKRVVDALDREGKLAIIFDGQTAQGLRTLADVAQDVFTAPPGSVNFSNTSSAWMNGLDMIINTIAAGLPLPAGVMTNVLGPVRRAAKERPLKKEVQQLIGEPTQ